ncbi:hypothetical protein EPK99_23590 [Neorhizobium lilium]|uniref:Uncharacterized protein n=1 Tax=Neorhizobium lilium TaxID=2503024 RepID=A0A3S3RDN9_9HYPH|nr:hypothetical protein [Neorhizobium lilium]RWX74872.1 hypothetical protein EPK99_23590 [Neorhizobium lilium]
MKLNLKRIAGAVLALAAVPAGAADNPMWKDGLVWSCRFSSTIECERSQDCTTKLISGGVELDYRENNVTDSSGVIRPIKRHYVQTVTGSPISSEVKIELQTNDVLWLLPVDGAGTFSHNWIGAMVSPKPGVVLQELRPLECRPKP